MSFTSLEFIFIFFPLCLVGYYVLPKKCRNIFLLVASLVFYAAGEPRRMYLLVLGIVVNYVFGLLLAREYGNKHLKVFFLILSLGYNLGILFYYKYLMYSLGSANVALPLGISFYTFRTVSYCLDVYWGMMPANKGLAEVALYISFFPQISMGPISRYTDFMEEVNGREFDLELFLGGMKRIIIGLFKKLVIADTLVETVNTSFGMQPSERSAALAWLGLLAFLVQLYFDFMGYTDIAIGLGNLFGFHLPENFDYPYAAASATDFWNRWHMTLGAWFKSYIYIPIFRACQGRKWKRIRCYLVASLAVWLFTGAWHGIGMKTIYYGLYYYVLIAGERLVADCRKARRKRLGIKKKPASMGENVGAHIYAAIAILFGQLLFKCESMGQYGGYVMSLFGLGGGSTQAEAGFYLRQDLAPLALGCLLSFPIVPYVAGRLQGRWERATKVLSPVFYLAMLVISLAFAFTSTYKSFVYFQF